MSEITLGTNHETGSYNGVEEQVNERKVEERLERLREKLIFNEPDALTVFHEARNLVHKAAQSELNSIERKTNALFFMKKLLEEEVGYTFLMPKFNEDFTIFLNLLKRAVNSRAVSPKVVDEMFYSLICHGYLREPAFNERLLSYISNQDIRLLARMEALNSSLLKQATQRSLATFDRIAIDVQATKDPAVYLRFYEMSKTMSSHRPMNASQLMAKTKVLARALPAELRVKAFEAILEVEMNDRLATAAQTRAELQSYKSAK
ncbi:MAG: hypothetical protein H7A38_01395 [Chlamydiales bacterium]|nr:hypothetical protein [Chlamydiales bacterium]